MKPVIRRIASCRTGGALWLASLVALCLSTPAHATGLANCATSLGAELSAMPWFLLSAAPAGNGIGFLPLCLILFLSGICLRQFIH